MQKQNKCIAYMEKSCCTHIQNFKSIYQKTKIDKKSRTSRYTKLLAPIVKKITLDKQKQLQNRIAQHSPKIPPANMHYKTYEIFII